MGEFYEILQVASQKSGGPHSVFYRITVRVRSMWGKNRSARLTASATVVGQSCSIHNIYNIPIGWIGSHALSNLIKAFEKDLKRGEGLKGP